MINNPTKLIYMFLILITLGVSSLHFSKKEENITIGAALYLFEVTKISVQYNNINEDKYRSESTMKYIELEFDDILTSELMSSINTTKNVQWQNNKKYIDMLNDNISHIITLYYSDTTKMRLYYLNSNKLLLIGADPLDYVNVFNSQNNTWLIMGRANDKFDQILYELFQKYD